MTLASTSGMATIDRQSRHVQHVNRWIQVPCSNTPDATMDSDPHSVQFGCSLIAGSSANRASAIEPTDGELDDRHTNLRRLNRRGIHGRGGVVTMSHDETAPPQDSPRAPRGPSHVTDRPAPTPMSCLAVRLRSP